MALDVEIAPMINRRSFLTLTPLMLLTPTLLIPKRTYFLPPRGGWYMFGRNWDLVRYTIPADGEGLYIDWEFTEIPHGGYLFYDRLAKTTSIIKPDSRPIPNVGAGQNAD